jgi:hypothetical protein
MILAAKSFITHPTMDDMKRRTAHLQLAQAYNLPVGDAVKLMRGKYEKKEIDLDIIWPPSSFDETHPYDPGYILYAEAAWAAFREGVEKQMTAKAPDNYLFPDTYAKLARVAVSSLRPLPSGWSVEQPKHSSVAYDFMMSRWLPDVTVAANCRETKREKYELRSPPESLKVNFRGSTVLLFGESTPISGKFKVKIDEKMIEREFDAGYLGKACRGNAHMWIVIAEGLDGKSEHTMEIIPQFIGQEPQEMRIESICTAGPEAASVSSSK